ncbi:tetraspanin-8-like [Paramormyrops kingsleyae]|uniref:tetraspanin-8-like n=1 Tax=Paramormyrops kingsleyae TaxID=1676925 RepID=UPI003B9791E2
MAVNKFIKYSLFIFNFLFWLCGCGILAISIYLKVTNNGNKVLNVTIPGVDLLIAIGAVIMVLGFLGCCGAVRESRCMLLLFFIGLLLIFILLLAAGILGAVAQSQVDSWLKGELQKLMPLSNQPSDVQHDIGILQQEGLCCGLTGGPQDWANQVPDTCKCTNTSAQCAPVAGNSVYTTPCVTYLTNIMKKNAKIVAGIGFAIGVVMLIGMSFAMTLYCQIGRKGGVTTS